MIIIFSALFIFSFLLTYLIRFFSIKKNILDIPNQRSLHQSPVPRGGGLAFVIVFYCALFLLWLYHVIQSDVFLSLLGGVPIACIGYCDDIFGISSEWRACVHILSSVWGIFWLGGIPFLNFGVFILHAPILFFIIGIFLTVWFVNLYNFMDGIDGLAGMEAVFVSGAAGGILFFHGFNGIAFICLALTFSVLGFLILNWSPAKIFMGDIGSGFLGYMFAMLMWITNNQYQLPFPAWWILLSVFIADSSYTLIYRMRQKKNLLHAHREHAYQRLVQSGLTHKTVVFGVLCINFLVCLPFLEIYYHVFRVDFLIFYFILLMSLFWLGWFYITKKFNIC